MHNEHTGKKQFTQQINYHEVANTMEVMCSYKYRLNHINLMYYKETEI